MEMSGLVMNMKLMMLIMRIGSRRVLYFFFEVHMLRLEEDWQFSKWYVYCENLIHFCLN